MQWISSGFRLTLENIVVIMATIVITQGMAMFHLLRGEGVVEKVSKTLKIIPAQTSFLREFQQYASLTTRWNAISDDITRASYDNNRCGVNETSEKYVEKEKNKVVSVTAEEELKKEFKAFRLGVKRRILKDLPDLAALPKPQMQRELESEYEAQKERYESLLKKKDRILATKGGFNNNHEGGKLSYLLLSNSTFEQVRTQLRSTFIDLRRIALLETRTQAQEYCTRALAT